MKKDVSVATRPTEPPPTLSRLLGQRQRRRREEHGHDRQKYRHQNEYCHLSLLSWTQKRTAGDEQDGTNRKHDHAHIENLLYLFGHFPLLLPAEARLSAGATSGV